MKRKTRLIILLICVVLFLIIAPYIVLYSLGYRVDFANYKITATGGIYVRVYPTGADVNIDNTTKETTSYFYSSVFVQNLTPGTHQVSVAKEGYYDYAKSLAVKEKEVTKLENITLFKKVDTFASLAGNVDYFSVAKDNATILTAKKDPSQLIFSIISPTATSSKQPIVLAGKYGATTSVVWSYDSKKALINIQGAYYVLDLSLATPAIAPMPTLATATSVTFNSQDSTELFYLKKNNLYSSKVTLPLALNVLAYYIDNQTATWLATDGFIYSANLTEKVVSKISNAPVAIQKTAVYKISNISSNIYLLQSRSQSDTGSRTSATEVGTSGQDSVLFTLDQKAQLFKTISTAVTNLTLSPDGQKIAYYNANEIDYITPNIADSKAITLRKSTSAISNVTWLNNDYVIFTEGNSVVISEIDVRGNINTVTLPATITLGTQAIIMKSPQFFFNQQDKKLYLLTQNNLVVSDRLLP